MLTRAGLVVGFSGVLAGLAVSSKSLLTLPGFALAAVAAILAASVLLPRRVRIVSPRGLREGYLTRPPQVAQLTSLDQRIEDYEKNQERIKTKITRFERSIVVFVIALVAVFAGDAVSLILAALR